MSNKPKPLPLNIHIGDMKGLKRKSPPFQTMKHFMKRPTEQVEWKVIAEYTPPKPARDGSHVAPVERTEGKNQP